MIVLADSTVWVDYLRGVASTGAAKLDEAISTGIVVLGDLILAEVLRGMPDERTARHATANFDNFSVMTLGGKVIAIKAAENYRLLRAKGVTLRGTVDLIIGTWCIEYSVPLIHADRDLEGMEKWLGLQRYI